MTFTEEHGESLEKFSQLVGVDMAAHIAGITNEAEERWETLVDIFMRSHDVNEPAAFLMPLQGHDMGTMLMLAAAKEAMRREQENTDG